MNVARYHTNFIAQAFAHERTARRLAQLSVRFAAGAGRGSRGCAAHPLAADAAAIRARSHQLVVAEGSVGLHANRLWLRRRCDARAVDATLRNDARAPADRSYRRDALPP